MVYLKVVDGGHEFSSIYLPASLLLQVLKAAHDDLGHNGFPRTFWDLVPQFQDECFHYMHELYFEAAADTFWGCGLDI